MDDTGDATSVLSPVTTRQSGLGNKLSISGSSSESAESVPSGVVLTPGSMQSSKAGIPTGGFSPDTDGAMGRANIRGVLLLSEDI